MAEITTAKGESFLCPKGQTLLEALLAAKVFIESPCGGMGKCGKCRVRITGGVIPPPTDEERACLSGEELAAGFRLACALRPEGDMKVELPERESGHAILADGYMPDFTPDTLNDEEPPYGLAVDIGTTTVVASLLDLRDGRELGTEAEVNPQRNQGLDVLSRISYAQEHGREGRDVLQRSIVGALETMALSLCAKNHVSPSSLGSIAVAANTTMLHLLLGADPSPLGIRPFTPVFTSGQSVKAGDVGMERLSQARLITLPLVSATIGADIVAGAYVCDMEHEKESTLFIDIGTNGEMVLAHGGELLACSCAAGPALEGMNISCGMRAAAGAVEAVTIGEDGEVRLGIIGNAPPRGICGSGILSAIHEMLKISLIGKNGRLVREGDPVLDETRRKLCCIIGDKPAVRLSRDIVITQGDVRQVQLAKGAVLSGVTALLNRAGLEAGALEKVLVAGQFGAHLPAEDLLGCGLLPDAMTPDHVRYVGNTSKTGACMALLSKKARAEMEALARKIGYIELAEIEDYDRLFAGCMRFPA
ncbi:MAG: DUF4445 domain-containing protein [Synergistaceae bacterium]|nr:DUF4445 domain-containing protein [Synergistaceae bacterium]